MRDRILEFLRKENKTSAQFAEEIGVQPSGISHILSGRNKPSLDFVVKMLEKYNYISSDWLIFGKGNMYKETKQPDLFSVFTQEEKATEPVRIDKTGELQTLSHAEAGIQVKPDSVNEKSNSQVTKIVWFYGDNSFEEYNPRKD